MSLPTYLNIGILLKLKKAAKSVAHLTDKTLALPQNTCLIVNEACPWLT